MNLVTPGKLLVESRMVDTGMITRDITAQNDDVLDEDTLQLIAPANDKFVVYEGRCILSPITRKELEYVSGEQPLFRKMYRLIVPLEVYDLRIGDMFTLLMAGPSEDTLNYDQNLVGREMRVQEIDGGSYRTCRRMHVEDIQEDHGNTRG